MNGWALQFSAPYRVDVVAEAPVTPGPGTVRIETLVSGISSGTEMLVFKGEFPEDLPVDATLPALAGAFAYPLRYGYCCVGEVAALGPGVDPSWLGRTVFVFHPHTSHPVVSEAHLIPVPDGVDPEDALFLPSVETALGLVMDGRPLVGERVVVLGLGVVGLTTVALLGRFPLERLVGIDHSAFRRDAARTAGADAVFADASAGARYLAQGRKGPEEEEDGKADLAFELTGDPAALDGALGCTGFAGRVVVGSWYGTRRAPVDLGGRFHRSRIRIVSSQVSTIDPELSGRWTRGRRLSAAWRLIAQLGPSRWVTHRFPVQDAQKAYDRIAQGPEGVLQVVIHYPAR